MTETFKVLDDREHVLTRPAMYIGSVTPEPNSGIINYVYQTKTVVPGLIKIIEEVIQNSVDEHIRTRNVYATKIDIKITNTPLGPEVSLTDNGRGIPVEKIGDSYRPILAWTKLRAGSNFDDSNRVGAGMNGVGVSLTNIYSKLFIGTSCDGTNKIVVTCKNNMSEITHKITKGTTKGVHVQFVPDLAKFNLTEFTQDHIDVLKDRITNLAVQYPAITFSFNDEKIKFKNVKQVAKLFHEDAVSLEGENFSFVFAPSGSDEEFRCLSYVNGIYVKNGGAHIDYILAKIIESVREFVKKKHKIEVPPNQIKQHLLFASWINNFPNLKFDSQTKERITNSNSEISAVLGSIDYEKVAKQIISTASIIDPMIDAILYKRELAEKMALAKKQKNAAKVSIAGHIAATSSDVSKKMLLICEGESATNPIISVRDPKYVGGYALKGKPLNITGKSHLTIMEDKEISDLLSIIGLELGKPAATADLYKVIYDNKSYIVGKADSLSINGTEIKVESLKGLTKVDCNRENLTTYLKQSNVIVRTKLHSTIKYGKVAVFSDADVDGQHILGLLLNLFSHWPELFTNEHIYRLRAPLYRCSKGKDIQYFYNKTDYENANLKGYAVKYYKGLGSMSEDAYSDCVNKPRLIKITADSYNMIEMAFGKDADPRKTWLLGE